MIPTIDIGVTSVLAAIGTFFVAVWNIIVRFLSFWKDKVHTLALGTRLGRALLEFTLFGVLFAFFVLFVQRLGAYLLSLAFDSILPSSSIGIIRMFQFINFAFPFNELVSAISYCFLLYLLRHSVMAVYVIYIAVYNWIWKFFHVGRV